MKLSDIELPSNSKFGFFFTFIFAVVTAYFFTVENLKWAYVFIATALLFLLITLVNDKILLPLNKLWMRFGLLLGIIIRPIVLGIIFFGLITPYGLIMRLFRRDELRLHKRTIETNWISRSQDKSQTDFTKQF